MSRLNRRVFLRAALAAGATGAIKAWSDSAKSGAADTADRSPGEALPDIDPNENLIRAPDDPAHWAAFRDTLTRWREETKARLRYNGALYRREDFAWVSSCYSCCFLMMCDETFYDPKLGRYTIESFLDDGVNQFGGYDGVVLWHAYPRIGVDERNQFDFYRDMPGGLGGLREITGAFHARHVKVFINYNPWDTGTRREGISDIDAVVSLVKAIDADGIFLDTMSRGAAELRAKLDAARPGVVLEGEGALPLENVHDHHMSWAQVFRDSRVPGILRNKWFERRHMLHQIDRWSRDHAAELHTAWMNGSGMMVWENVFGTWVGWNARDRSILRAMLPIQRRYIALFSGEKWIPLVETEAPDVYASLWESNGLRLWTLVNRSERTAEGALLRVPHVNGARYFDLVLGREVKTQVRDGTVTLSGLIRPRGIGALVSGTDESFGRDFPPFLASQKNLDGRADFSTDFPARRALLSLVTPTKTYRKSEIPKGMVAIARAST